MKIVFASATEPDPDVWIQPLQKALPETEVLDWNAVDGPIHAQLAVVWNPPVQLFLRETQLQGVFNLGAGVDAIFKLPGIPGNMPVYRLEDAGMAVQMAEYTAYALLRISRRFDEYRLLQQGKTWRPQPDIDRSSWPVGVLGTGVMGRRVAEALASLDYNVAAWSRSQKDIPRVESFAGPEQFDEFLARTRVLINTLPLTDETHSILNRKTFMSLLPDAHIINVGRGEHLVEEDLLAILDTGHIQGASLDVFTEEPLPEEHPFWKHPAINITPHIAAVSLRNETISQTAMKIRAFLEGKPITGLAPRDRGY